MSKDVRRLFSQFRPEHYQLELEPDAKTMTFRGRLTVSGQKVGRPSQRLTFHQHGLKISHASLTHHDKSGQQAIKLDRINHHAGADEVRLHSSSLLYPGRYSVEMEFSGKITQQMNGLYPCFFEHDGQAKKLLATQFESHHAREVFPCIDEPEAKSVFELTLTTPERQTVLANTPIAKQTKKGRQLVTHFEPTPKMSAYLLAFVVGEVGYKQAITKDGVQVRTYATPDNVKLTDFALDVAVRCLEFYNDYFGLPYPLAKCDLIALPDFASGAMENWGCITFREQCMLVDPKNTSIGVKQYVAMVVAHELAHQWFGNLVTMRWWTDLWLNEGFASWIEYLAIDHLFPDWQMWTQFITDEQQIALRLDALENTHPIEVPVHHPDEIRTIFDTISYNKGASAIHMLHNYLGAKAFRDGLRQYLKQHQYGNTDTTDLWAALAKASGQAVDEFMQSWTGQPGFPLVHSTLTDGRLALHQKRFRADPQATTAVDTIWPVPLRPAGELPQPILVKQQANWQLAGRLKNAKAVKLNLGQTGFYRVTYDANQLAELARQIREGQLAPLDRLGILSDSFESAKAGYTSTTDALRLLSSFDNEDNSAVWDVIAGLLGSVRTVMDDETLRELLKPFVRKLVSKQLHRLGWKANKNEPYFDSLLRPTIIGLAAVADEPAVVKECLDRFKSMKRPDDLPADLRSVIYGTASRHGDQATFKKLLELHNSSSSSEERTTLAAAITAFEQPELIQKALATITTKTVRLQDVGYWIAYSFMNRHAKRATWHWLTKNWSWLENNLGTDMSFSRFPLYAARSFSDPVFLKDYRKFFEPRITPALERSYKQGLETTTWQAAWKKRDLKTIRQFFASEQQLTP